MKRFTFLIIVVAIFGCSNQQSSKIDDGSRFAISFPKSDRNLVQGKTSTFDYNNGCYAVSVIVPENSGAAVSECDRDYGILQGMVSPTADPETDQKNRIEIVDIPFGDNREIVIYALNKDVGSGGCPSVDSTNGFGDLPRNRLFEVGRKPFSNFSEEVQVKVEVSMPASSSENLMERWSLPASCPKSETGTQLANLQTRSRQVGGNFIIERRNSSAVKTLSLKAEGFSLDLRGR